MRSPPFPPPVHIRARGAKPAKGGELEVLTKAIQTAGKSPAPRGRKADQEASERTHATIARAAETAGRASLERAKKLVSDLGLPGFPDFMTPSPDLPVDLTTLNLLCAYEDTSAGILRSGLFVCTAAELTFILSLESIYLGDGEDLNATWTGDLGYGERKPNSASIRILECRSAAEDMSETMQHFLRRPVGYNLRELAMRDGDGQRWTFLEALESSVLKGERAPIVYHELAKNSVDSRVRVLELTIPVYNAVMTKWGWVDDRFPLITPANVEYRKWWNAPCGDGKPRPDPTGSGSAFMCDHANECPAQCPCGPTCYCKSNTCKPAARK